MFRIPSSISAKAGSWDLHPEAAPDEWLAFSKNGIQGGALTS